MKLSKRGEWIRIHACGEKYGWGFVLDTIDKAVQVKEAEEMATRKPRKMSKIEKEARILAMAEKMGVKLYG